MVADPSLRHGDHVCIVCDTAEDQVRTIVEYVKNGLDTSERCVYAGTQRGADHVCAALARAGLDVAAVRDSSRLLFWTTNETYPPHDAFDPDLTIQALTAMTDEALSDSCTGLRIIGEMTWPLGGGHGRDRLLDYETKLGEFLAENRAHALCQYVRERFPAPILYDVLRRHPMTLVGNAVCANVYYEPPELIGLPEGHERRVAHMLDVLFGDRLRAQERRSSSRIAG